MFYWNDSAYIRRDSNELILQGLKSRVRVKISDLSTNLFGSSVVSVGEIPA